MTATAQLGRWQAASLYAALAVVFGGAIAARTVALETGAAVTQPQVTPLLYLCLAATLAGAVLIVQLAYRVVPRMGNHELAVISMLAAMHFAVSLLSRVAGTALFAVLGPYSVFVSGLGDEGIPCLLLAVTAVLFPKPGAVMLNLLTVFLLNVLFTGTLGLSSLLFICVSVLLHEGMLGLLGVTTSIGSRLQAREGGRLQAAGCRKTCGLTFRVAVAIALANAGTLMGQFTLFRLLFRLHFDAWYIAAVVVVTGLIYGGIGAALGTWLGGRLRGIATS